jgi:hypothetical protein
MAAVTLLALGRPPRPYAGKQIAGLLQSGAAEHATGITDLQDNDVGERPDGDDAALHNSEEDRFSDDNAEQQQQGSCFENRAGNRSGEQMQYGCV